MNRIILKDIEMYLEQLQDFLQSDRDTAELTVRARKTSDGDCFKIEFDKEAIWPLIVILASDQTLGTLAQLALIHTMSQRSDNEIEECFQKLKEMSMDLRREVNGDNRMFFISRNQSLS